MSTHCQVAKSLFLTCLELVACPICSRQIPESDINLHLDLQCPGNPSTSTATSSTKVTLEPSHSSLKSSPGKDVIEISDTPPRPTNGETAGSGSKIRSGNVASIFGPRKRVKLEEPEDEPSQTTTSKRPSTQARSQVQPKGVVKEEPAERKPKVNPLVANQPYVFHSFFG